MKLYKYTKKSHAELMVHEGIFRLGTLKGYKKIEKHGTEIGDEREGEMITHMDRQVIDSSLPETLSPVAQRILNSGHIVAGRVILITEQIHELTDNCLVYSTSCVADHHIMKRINPDYDACVEISDMHAFFEALGNCVKNQFPELQSMDGDFCVYSNREQHHTQQVSVHPAFVKEKRYAYQQEHRVIWPIQLEDDYFDLHCEKAKQFCSIIEI